MFLIILVLTFYRYFGVGSAVAGLLYFFYEFCYVGGFRSWCRDEDKVSRDERPGAFTIAVQVSVIIQIS